jgi:hypothetical protein
LQALAVDPVSSDTRNRHIMPLAIGGLCLTLAWYLAPDQAPMARFVLTTATLAYAAAGAWLMRQRQAGPAFIIKPLDEEPRPPRPAVLPRDFERFMEDGIVASRRRGRTAALLRIAFAMPDLLISDQDKVLETIGENARDVTRAYDFVYVPGDGTIMIFIAHVPLDAELPAIARRIIDDLRQCGGPASAALSTELQAAAFGEDETSAALVKRVLAEKAEIIAL